MGAMVGSAMLAVPDYRPFVFPEYGWIPFLCGLGGIVITLVGVTDQHLKATLTEGAPFALLNLIALLFAIGGTAFGFALITENAQIGDPAAYATLLILLGFGVLTRHYRRERTQRRDDSE